MFSASTVGVAVAHHIIITGLAPPSYTHPKVQPGPFLR